MKNPSLLSKLPVLLLSMALLPGGIFAQGDANARGWLRILPLGDGLPWREVIENGKRMQVAGPEGSSPPRQLKYPAQEGEENDTVDLAVGNFSDRFPAKVGAVPLSDPKGVAGEAWHTLKMPARSSALALLWRDPKGKDWSKAQSMMLPDDLTAFPAGSVRIVNVSNLPVGVKLKGKAYSLLPGKQAMVAAGAMKQVPLEIHAPHEGTFKKIQDRALVQDASQRTNIVVYTADGVKPPKPVGVLIQRERAVIPPLRKKAG